MAERLGDVPVAVLEKGKQPGSHLLSGAVVNPVSLRALFNGRVRTDAMPFLGRVEHESVYFLTPRRAMRIPAPPTMRNRGNYVASLSQLGRWLAEQAEEAGATILPETAASKLLVADGRVRGVQTGDRGRGRSGEELSNFEPGSDVLARVTVLAEGHPGPPDRCRARPLRARGREPTGLGARREGGLARPEAARPRDPHAGLAAARRQALPGVRRLVHLPDGRRHGHARDGRRPRLPRRRALGARPAPGAEDPPARPEDPRGRRAGRVGRQDDPRGRLPLAAEAAARARAADLRRRRGARERARAQGDPLRRRVGTARGRGGVRVAAAGRDAVARGSARALRRRRCGRASSGRT